MTAERSIEILTAGLKAAHGRMVQGKGPQRPEYPRDFEKMYGWSEDNFFNLLTAIKNNDLPGIRETAADIIVAMSEIAEYAERVEKLSTARRAKP